jgi:hypothetical protein
MDVGPNHPISPGLNAGLVGVQPAADRRLGHDLSMSFDVYLQAFAAGAASVGDGQAALAVLEPFVVDRAEGFAGLSLPDGAADVYGVGDPGSGLMFNHIGGRAAWHLIYEVAKVAGFAIMPVGCGTLVPDETLREQLPADVPTPVMVVRSGAEILAAIGPADS